MESCSNQREYLREMLIIPLVPGWENQCFSWSRRIFLELRRVEASVQFPAESDNFHWHFLSYLGHEIFQEAIEQTLKLKT